MISYRVFLLPPKSSFHQEIHRFLTPNQEVRMQSTRVRIQVSNQNHTINPAAALAIFVVIGLLLAGIAARYVSHHKADYTATTIRQ